MTTKNLNTTSQNEAFVNILNKLEDIVKTGMLWDNMVSLSGAAGTGKTYLTSKLIEKLNKEYHITITAPTHKALQVLRHNLLANNADKIETKTLQAFLNIKLVTNFDNGSQRFEPIKLKDKDNSKTDILIVDESSMISADLYDYIVQAIESYRIKAVLFVGDEYQLLPIDNKDTKIFDIKTKYKLDKIVRQAKDSYIITMATKARNIIKSKQYISLSEFLNDDTFSSNVEFFTNTQEFYNDFCTPNDWATQDKVIASFTNKSVDTHNNIIRNRYWQEQNITNIPIFLVGDEIIFQEANVINEKIIHQNSDIVKLSLAKKTYQESLQIYFWDCKDLDNKPFKIVDPASTLRFRNVLNKIAKEARAEKNYKLRTTKWKLFYNIKETFVDVKYTYASTIHKLQGSTYETVYIDLNEIENMKDKDMMFRLLYVAITRASKNIKILLPNESEANLINFQSNILNSIDDSFANLGLNI
jgi:ATP-dependent exoDNAse (exonuclease V) alpha subunit